MSARLIIKSRCLAVHPFPFPHPYTTTHSTPPPQTIPPPPQSTRNGQVTNRFVIFPFKNYFYTLFPLSPLPDPAAHILIQQKPGPGPPARPPLKRGRGRVRSCAHIPWSLTSYSLIPYRSRRTKVEEGPQSLQPLCKGTTPYMEGSQPWKVRQGRHVCRTCSHRRRYVRVLTSCM